MGVYEILTVASLTMGLFAFCCSQLVSTIILRKRFMSAAPRSALQDRLHLALYLTLAICGGLWGYGFVICVRQVWVEVINGNWLPMPLFLAVFAMALAGLVIVSWFSVRQRTKDLTRLATEIQALRSGNGPMLEEVTGAALPDTAIRPLTEKARHAVLYLGAESYRATLELLQRVNNEPPRRTET
ncbi:MAG: hypothetical protein FJ147_26545 [Deltaproteobacteria bacterium]|nr:hypothetical protein [Deltaproteobacteria bacterium]